MPWFGSGSDGRLALRRLGSPGCKWRSRSAARSFAADDRRRMKAKNGVQQLLRGIAGGLRCRYARRPDGSAVSDQQRATAKRMRAPMCRPIDKGIGGAEFRDGAPPVVDDCITHDGRHAAAGLVTDRRSAIREKSLSMVINLSANGGCAEQDLRWLVGISAMLSMTKLHRDQRHDSLTKRLAWGSA